MSYHHSSRTSVDAFFVGLVVSCVCGLTLACNSDTAPSAVKSCAIEVSLGAVVNDTIVKASGDGPGTTDYHVDSSTRYEKLDPSNGRITSIGLADILTAYRGGIKQRLRIEKIVPAHTSCDSSEAAHAESVRVVETTPAQAITGYSQIVARRGNYERDLFMYPGPGALWVLPWTTVDAGGDFTSLDAMLDAQYGCAEFDGFVMSPASWPLTIQATNVKFLRLDARGGCHH
jgi:hypothetical protein